MNHFATQARRQAALQKFYQVTQLPSKSVNQYYYRIKALARATFHDLGAEARAQQVTARMKQGICPEIWHILVGRDFATAKDLCAAIENIELEIGTSKDTAVATKDDLKEVIQALKSTMIDNKGWTNTV